MIFNFVLVSAGIELILELILHSN